MRHQTRRSATSLLAIVALFGCTEAPTEVEELEQASQPLTSVCADAPGLYFVDGIPAYAQCAASSNAAIYSNNGVDTATSALGSDWKRTQYSGGYQCTELVHRYWLFRWNVTWIPNGNAGTWCDATPPSSSGITQTTVPVHGDAIVFAPGVCGAAASTGHVALVDTVDASGSKVTIVEENNAGRRSVAVTCATCFLHVVANNGTPSAGGSTSTGGATGTTAVTAGGASIIAMGGATTSRPVAGAPSTGGTSSAASSTAGLGGANTATTSSSPPLAVGGSPLATTTTPATTTPIASSGGAQTTTNVTTPTASTGGSVGAPSAPGIGGSTVAVSEPTTTDASESDAGCTCAVPSRRPAGGLGLGLLASALLGLRRRRRAARSLP